MPNCKKCLSKPATTTDPQTDQPLCQGCYNVVTSMRSADPVKLYAYLGGSTPKAAAGPLTVQEAADLLNVSLRTVYRLTESGELPHQRIGKAIRIKPADLERYQARLSESTGSLFG
jgi:excisionase family DNA binding protein